jgi:hypothetical protein
MNRQPLSLHSIARSLPLLRGFTSEVSPYFAGSVLENRLGLQVFRTIGKHLAWRLRTKESDSSIKEYADVLERDGVLRIPDFLPRDQFLAVLKEVEAAEADLPFKPFRDAEHGKLNVAKFQLNGNSNQFSAIREYLQRNELILALASLIIRRPNTSLPSVLISIYRSTDTTAPDNDIENILHADLHTPTVKAFYYLNDIDETNGAFVYAKGSHKFSLERLRHEYDISVRNAKLNRKGSDLAPELIGVRGIHRRPLIAPKHQERIRVKETHFTGKANTLIITNNMGFHRRGEFTSSKPRKTILINFRHLERCF